MPKRKGKITGGKLIKIAHTRYAKRKRRELKKGRDIDA